LLLFCVGPLHTQSTSAFIQKQNPMAMARNDDTAG